MNEFALPKSAELVLFILSTGPKTISELREMSSLPSRTLRFALRRLKELNLVKELRILGDTRRKIYVKI